MKQELIIQLILGATVLITVALFVIINKIQENKIQRLFKELNFAKNEEIVKYKKNKNTLEVLKYNPAITPETVSRDHLIAISKAFNEEDNYIIAEYRKANFLERILFKYNNFKLVLIKESIELPKIKKPNLKKYEFSLGKNLKNQNIIKDFNNKNALTIKGPSRSGKSVLANNILKDLLENKSIEEAYVFTKNSNDFATDPIVKKINKDKEELVLETLKEIREFAQQRNGKLELEGYNNIFQKNEKIVLCIFDEAHSYLKNESKNEIKKEIIKTVDYLLKQAGSAGICLIFINQSADRDSLDVDDRLSQYLISAKLNSKELSKNLLMGSEIGTMISNRPGTFVINDGREIEVFKVEK